MPSLAEILNQKGQLEPTEKKQDFRVKMIHHSKLTPSQKNFYSIEDIEDLADLLLLSGEIKQNLLVRKAEAGTYEIIAGHKRHLAAALNVERGHRNFEFLPCKLEEQDDLLAEFNLITTNSSQRDRSEYERMQEAMRLREIIPQLLQDETLKGRALRRLVAQELNTSISKVGQYENINNNLIDAGKERFASGDLGITAADSIASLPEGQQEEILQTPGKIPAASIDAVKEDKPLNIAEIKAIINIGSRDERVIDILTYNNSKAEITEGIKNVFGESGGSYSGIYYNFSPTKGIKLQVEAYDQREMSWSQFAGILIEEFKVGNIKTKLPTSKPSPAEEQYIADALKRYELPGDRIRGMNELIDLFEAAGETAEEVQALKSFIFFQPGRKELEYRYRRMAFDEDSIKYYHNNFSEEPKRILPWEELAAIFGKALERGWITKTVPEPGTNPVIISTLDDVEGQASIEDYTEKQPEENLEGTRMEFIQSADAETLTKWLYMHFHCPADCDLCMRQQEPIPETEAEETDRCIEHWKAWLLSTEDR